MKLLYVLTVFPKLSETFILDQITRLIDRGYEVDILSYLAPDDLEPKDSIVDDKVHDYKLLERTFYLQNILGSQSDYLDFQATSKLQISPRLTQLVRQSDLILSHFADRPTQIAEQLSSSTGIPYIFIAHARDIFVNPNIQKLRSLANHASKILVPTEYNKQYLIHLLGSCFSEKILVLRCGIDTSRFKCNRSTRRSPAQLTILTVGRLVEKKGLHDTIDAFAKIHPKYPNAFLRIIGEGPLLGEIIEKVNRLKIADRVVLLGACHHQQVKEQMQYADIFILPSCTAHNGDREGLPVSILEASAMKLPVLSTFHTGISEGVLDGETGYLVQERNVIQLANKLEILLQNDDLRQSMGEKGRQHVEAHFNIDFEISKLVCIVQDVIKMASIKT